VKIFSLLLFCVAKLNMKKDKTMISLQISKELLSKLKDFAKDNETTVAAVIRQAVIDYLKEHKQYK